MAIVAAILVVIFGIFLYIKWKQGQLAGQYGLEQTIEHDLAYSAIPDPHAADGLQARTDATAPPLYKEAASVREDKVPTYEEVMAGKNQYE